MVVVVIGGVTSSGGGEGGGVGGGENLNEEMSLGLVYSAEPGPLRRGFTCVELQLSSLKELSITSRSRSFPACERSRSTPNSIEVSRRWRGNRL